MKESVVVTKIRKNFLGIIHKNHGSPFGIAGLPDLEGCLSGNVLEPGYIRGQSCVIEVKVGHIGRNDRVVLKSPVTKIQEHWLGEYDFYGALALVAVYLEDRKKIIFFHAPWDLHIENAFTDIGFLNEKFVKKEVWTERTEKS